VSVLPNGWVSSSLGDLADYIQRGKSPKYTEHSELPVINQKCIRWNGLEVQHLKYIHPDQFSSWDKARFVTPGDILWNSTGTGTVGRAYLVQEADCSPPKVVDSHVTIVRSNLLIDSRYVFNWIKGTVVQNKIVDMCDGTTNQIELSRSAISATEIPLAPLPEQKRIADKLDAVLARVDACRDRLDRIPVILKRFRQSVLDAATSGVLTEGWRAETKAVDWRQTDVQSVAHVGTGSTPLRSHSTYFASTGTPWITSAATSQALVTDAREFVTQAAITAHRLKTYPIGTLLVAMYGEGKTRGQVTELGISATINQACAAIIVNEEKALKNYVKLALQANYFEMRELAEGGNQPNLNLPKIKEFPLSLPSIEEQTEIVRRVEALFAFADRLEARYKAARAQVDKLTPATLAKAFRGELVPQDPNDEPASVLLDRISAQRDEQTTAKPKCGRKLAG